MDDGAVVFSRFMWYNMAMGGITRKLKKYFIPHEENDYKPHILRPRIVAFVIIIALALESLFIFGSSAVITRSKFFGIVLVNALIDETNAARAANNLYVLRENYLLDAAAQAKANDMVANNYFAHTSPSGVTPWYWFEKVGYNFLAAGENLAVNFSDSQNVTDAWLSSPEHRANITNAGFTDIGMATAQGEFNGQPAVYVVELFGKPAPPSAVAPIAAAAARPPEVSAKPAPELMMASTTGGDLFVAVKGAGTGIASEATATPAPLAHAEQVNTEQANIVQRAAANPRRTIDYFYLAVVLIFAAALVLNVFIKIHIQHSQVILGGMLVILIVGLLIVLNQHFAYTGVIII